MLGRSTAGVLGLVLVSSQAAAQQSDAPPGVTPPAVSAKASHAHAAHGAHEEPGGGVTRARGLDDGTVMGVGQDGFATRPAPMLPSLRMSFRS